MVEHLPYCGLPPHPGQLLQRFNLDPALIASLVLLGAVQCAWARGLRARACALAGWLTAAIALLSPLCALSLSLFSARLAQHMMLLLIAAPLIALGWGQALPQPLPQQSRRDSHRTGAVAIWSASAAFFIALWFWHMPSPYQATFDSSYTYWAMHISLFGSALLLWRALLRHRRACSADALTASIVSSLQMGLLGAVLTLAARPLYDWHLTTTSAWGLTPLQDQQLGGVLMWVPGIALFLWAGMRSLSQLWQSLERPAPDSPIPQYLQRPRD